MEHELIIVGGGPAGLTAGLYAARARRKVLLIEKVAVGGAITNTETIENYPGFPEPVSSRELMENLEKQAVGFGLEIKLGMVTDLAIDHPYKRISVDGETLASKALIIATGGDPNKLNVPGEKELTGRGVSYCAICDGPLFKGAHTLVAGGGNAAIEEALYLTKFAERVTVVHRRNQLRAAKILQERAFENKKIHFLWDSVISRINGSQVVEEVVVENVKTSQEQRVSADGVFIYIGFQPNTEFIQGTVRLSERLFVITNENMETSEPGILAAGDVRDKDVRQVVTAVADGATAAFSAERHLESLNN
jgi:thioredoxin reductase (NADPH)